MRLAGTCSTYSKSAMPQLTTAARYQGVVSRCFRCPYQATVMKRFDATSNVMVSATVWAGNMRNSSVNSRAFRLSHARDAMVPHLTTSLTGPLHEIERIVLDQRPEIERWFRTQWQEQEVPFYASVDLRNSGFKLAPVDTNLFPGGFNNLNPEFLPLCVHAAMSAVQRICPDTRQLLLVPENHTRNLK